MAGCQAHYRRGHGLGQHGVRSIVNLELLHDDLEALRHARPSVDEARTVDYFRIRDWEPNVVIAPGVLDAHVAEFIAIARSRAKPLYVHCRSGQNRTGVMVAAYRVLEEGMPIEAAIAEMGRYQGIWFAQDAAYIRQLVGARRAALERLVAKRLPQLAPTARLECTASGCRDIAAPAQRPGAGP